ncbi:MAG: tetratricopeptide repeat protein, partial [Anaerolineales bacterium]
MADGKLPVLLGGSFPDKKFANREKILVVMILNTIKYSSIFLLLLSGFVIKGCNPYSLPENRFSKGETAFTVYQESLEQFRAGNFTEAQALITRAIKMNPGVAYFHELDGDIFRAQGNFERALKSYDRATALRSNYPEVYSSQAEIYIALNQHEEAMKSYKKILANDPMQLGAYLNIAEQYMELNEYVVALNSLADYRRLKLAYNETEEPLYYKIRAHIFYRQK